MTMKYRESIPMTRGAVPEVLHDMGLPTEDVSIFWRHAQKRAAMPKKAAKKTVRGPRKAA